MKPDNWNRFAAGLLAILLCLCSFSMPAFASGTDPAPEPLPEILDEKTTTGGMEPEGVPITPKGNATLVDDFYEGQTAYHRDHQSRELFLHPD
mgnify:CR=1 FL=1